MSRRLAVCNEPGCSRDATHRGKCERCHLERRAESDSSRPTATQRGYDHRWRRFKNRFLREHPLCSCGEHATQVHHIDGRGPRGPRGFDTTNCIAMCASCHSRLTTQMQPGGWNRR